MEVLIFLIYLCCHLFNIGFFGEEIKKYNLIQKIGFHTIGFMTSPTFTFITLGKIVYELVKDK